jgi:hypothetical protein
MTAAAKSLAACETLLYGLPACTGRAAEAGPLRQDACKTEFYV